MDNNQPPLSKEQADSKREQLERGQAFEELTTTKGFEYQKTYMANLLQNFVNQAMADPNTPLTTLEPLRQQIIGLKKMFGDIEWSIKALQDERTKE